MGLPEEKKKHISGATIHETGKYPGLRGWAARWEKIDVKILPGEKWTEGAGHLKLKLEDGVRKFAVVGLGGELASTDKGLGVQFDDEFWEEFLDNIAEEE